MNIIPNRVVQPNPIKSDAFVRILCERADMTFAPPFTPDEVVQLLCKVGYDCTRGTLLEFFRKGYISPPPNNEWTAPFVHGLIASMDCRRRWLPAPNDFHDARKSNALLQVESAAREGIDTFIDLDEYTLEDLLLHLTGTDNREIRETLYLACRRKMADLGFREE